MMCRCGQDHMSVGGTSTRDRVNIHSTACMVGTHSSTVERQEEATGGERRQAKHALPAATWTLR